MVLCERRALTLFDLSAQQGNSEAYIQLGDFYYYQRAGLLQAERKKEAARFYQKAADLHHTQAIFNLGIMHEVSPLRVTRMLSTAGLTFHVFLDAAS